MSWILWDADEWETVVTNEDYGFFPGTNIRMGSCGVSQRRRPAEEVAHIKAERQKKHEDEVLAEAQRILDRRVRA